MEHGFQALKPENFSWKSKKKKQTTKKIPVVPKFTSEFFTCTRK